MDNPYRKYILACKRKYGTARSQVKYKELVKAYKAMKEAYLEQVQP